MGYRLRDLDDVPAAVREVARERLEHAAAALEERGDAEAVHTARKDLKKTRSLLRLARPGLPRKAYRARNDALREIAADLAGTRDADALAATVEGLAEHADGRVMPEAFADLAAALRATAPGGDAHATTPAEDPALGAPGAPAAAPEDPALGAPGRPGAGDAPAGRSGVTADAARRLREAAADVDAWPLDDLDADALVAGVTRAYERGFEELRAARKAPTSFVLHEWRKRVKDLWYHARLLKVAAPGHLQPVVDDADALADLLGDEHDLSVLADRLDAGDPAVAGIVVEEAALRALLDERRDALRAEAGVLAARLYAERPKAFRRRVRALVRAKPARLGLDRAG